MLWLYGPSGVGKTTIAWDLYRSSVDADVALVELDQIALGLAPADDPELLGVRSENMAGILANLRDRGAGGVVVTSTAAGRRVVDRISPRLAGVSITTCRIHAEPAEHAERFRSRNFMLDVLDSVVDEGSALEAAAPSVDCRVDTTGLAIVDAIDAIRATTGWKPRAPTGAVPPPSQPPTLATLPTSGAAIPLLWLCGARGSGKTSVGYRIAARMWRSGTNAAYVDLDQLGYCGQVEPERREERKVGNVAAVWRGFQQTGAECVVVSGSAEDVDVRETYGSAVPDAALTICRLDARPDVRYPRLLARARSPFSVGLPDQLKTLTDHEIARIAEQGAEHAAVLERAGVGDVVIETSDLSLDEVADHADALVRR